MFVIGVVSDSHIPDRARELHPHLLPRLRAAGVEMILHGGDVCVPGVLAEFESVAPVRIARGNRDWLLIGRAPWVQVFEVAGISIALMHGHGSWPKYLRDKFFYLRDGYKLERYQSHLRNTVPCARVVVFGHTHVAESIWKDGQLLFNPGSCSLGAHLGSYPTFGLLRIGSDGQVESEIHELEGYYLENKKWVSM